MSTFIPSEHSYGWASGFSLSTLTPTNTGINNQPSSSAHKANLSKLSDFLGKLPFKLRINSGYRSPAVNTAVGGSRTSQHPNGLAVDASPIGATNKDVAAWLYENRAKFPELDQVIWYTDTSHVHIGIYPAGATGCPRSSGPRGDFYRAAKEGSVYIPWAPTAADTLLVAGRAAAHHPGVVVGLWLGTGVAAAAILGGLFWFKRSRS